MDFPTFYAVVAASVPVILTIIFTVAKFSGKMGERLGTIETSLVGIDKDLKRGSLVMGKTLETLETHTKDCDLHRKELDMNVKQQKDTVKKQGKQLDTQRDNLIEHATRITGLEKA